MLGGAALWGEYKGIGIAGSVGFKYIFFYYVREESGQGQNKVPLKSLDEVKEIKFFFLHLFLFLFGVRNVCVVKCM